MKKLAICIPNYNRPLMLHRLLMELSKQITDSALSNYIEICVNDDCSIEKPHTVIDEIRARFSEVTLKFHVNEKNMGMDHNFLHSVLMSDAEFCWIIGNDDMPEPDALGKVLAHINDESSVIDILVSPFNVYDEDQSVLTTIYPIRNDEKQELYFDTSDQAEYNDLINRVNDGNALFCFLSNVIFRKADWVRHGNMFEDKMDTIFIQMYMNLQTLREGAIYKYTTDKFIRNYRDDEINATFKREYDVLVGLSGVVDYFFSGTQHRKLQECIVDERINGRMWDLPDDSELKQPILKITSPKCDLYREYFIYSKDRKDFFKDRNVLLYGAGDLGHKAVAELNGYEIRNLLIFDADKNKWGKYIDKYEICPPEMLYSEYSSKEYVVVVANCKALIEIVEMLRKNNVDKLVFIS